MGNFPCPLSQGGALNNATKMPTGPLPQGLTPTTTAHHQCFPSFFTFLLFLPFKQESPPSFTERSLRESLEHTSSPPPLSFFLRVNYQA